MSARHDTDVLIIGGGINGLTAAGLLARAGATVRLFERSPGFGGLAAVREEGDGSSAPLGAIDVGRFREDLAERLELSAHGWSATDHRAEELVGWCDPEQGLTGDAVDLRLFCDVDRAADALSRRSRADAEAWPRFVAHVASLLPRFESLLRGPATVDSAARLATDPELTRFATASLDDLLGWWFRSDALKVALGGLALHASGLAPRDQGTGWLLLDQLAGTTSERLRSGRMQSPGEDGGLVDALAASARAAGARLQSGLGVESIQVRSGRIRSVQLADGEEVRARLVISTLDAPATLLRLVGARHLPVEASRCLRRLRIHGTTARWSARDVGSTLPPVVVARSLHDMQRAADDAKRGRASRTPWAVRWGRSLDLHYLPYASEDPLEHGVWGPLASEGRLMSARERERTAGATGGGEHGGLLSLDQLLAGRGVAGCVGCRTPVEGLLLGGAAAHPGGGVTGLPAAAAVEDALRLLGRTANPGV